MAPSAKTPMVLIAGSLGSGKTTLLRHLVACAGDRRIAILMNEFGEIAIDSRVIEGKHIRMTELAGGCVCCSLTGEFEAAVREIIDVMRPELIVVETTGVAEPDAVIFDVEDNLPEVRLDSAVVIADADGMVRFPDLGYVTRSQFEVAGVILINKTDLVSEDELTAVEARLRRVNPDAAIFRTRRCEVDVALLFGVEERRDRRRPQTSAHAHHGPEVATFAFCSDRPLDRKRFEAIVEAMPPEVYRAKGFLRCPEGGFLFNFVAGRWDLEPFAAERTEVVFIGRGADATQASLLSQLHECEVRPPHPPSPSPPQGGKGGVFAV